MFHMQRYWGSDDEDTLSNTSTEVQKGSLEGKKISPLNEKITEKKTQAYSCNSNNTDSLHHNHSTNLNHKLLKLDNDVEIFQKHSPKHRSRNTFSSQNCSENSSAEVSSNLSFTNQKRKHDLIEDISIHVSDDTNKNSNQELGDKCETYMEQNFVKVNSSSPKTKRQRKHSNDSSMCIAIDCKSYNNKSSENVDEKTKVNPKLEINSKVLNVKEKHHSSSIKTEISLTNKKRKKKSKSSDESKLEEQVCEGFESKNEEDSDMNFLPIGQIKEKSDEKIKGALPKWLSSPTVIEVDLKGEEIPIANLNYLDDYTKQNLQKAKIQFLFPVQLTVIPWLLQNKVRQISIPPPDLCVSAPTGSGKTLAFVIPIIQSLKNRLVCAVRALVVLPVNELAKQVYKVFELFTKGTDLKVILLTGQKSFTAEQNAVIDMQSHRSLVDIIITTPGRILDHINRTKGFSLQSLQYLVIDEADRMMEEIQQGWLKQIEDAVYSDCQKSCICFSVDNHRMSVMPITACDFSFTKRPLQKLLYSATLSHDPEKLHSLSLYRPKLFTALSTPVEGDWIGKCIIPASLMVFYTICEDSIKPMVLCHLIKLHKYKKVLCFTDTVERAQRLHIVLEEIGILQVREISSINTQTQRKIVLEQFSCGKINVLVCSDLVARGIDIEDVDCVLSYDAPQSIKTYVHRIGRTARAGKNGTSVTLVSKGEFPSFKRLVLSAGMSLPNQMNINTEDLKEYIPMFQKALEATDVKLKKIKSAAQQRKHNRRKKNLKPM